MAELPLKDAIKVVYGKGERKLIVFTDANCPYCRLLEQNLRKAGNLTVYNFMYPVLRSREEARRIVWRKRPRQDLPRLRQAARCPRLANAATAPCLTAISNSVKSSASTPFRP